jgi:hypothetical protein
MFDVSLTEDFLSMKVSSIIDYYSILPNFIANSTIISIVTNTAMLFIDKQKLLTASMLNQITCYV